MKKVVLCFNTQGGAFLAASSEAKSTLADLFIISDSSLFDFIYTVRGSLVLCFHQPFSFLYAILSLFFVKPYQIELVLHESAYMSLRVSSPYSFFIFLFKFFTVHILCIAGCKIKSVSRYVSKTYMLPFVRYPLITYVYSSFSPSHSQSISFQSKPFVATIFLRPYGNDRKVLQIISSVLKAYHIKYCYIIGSQSQFLNIDGSCLKIYRYPILSRKLFLKLLSFSRLFISPFSREGFGLSVMEAMLYGNLVLCSLKGSYSEIVPRENFNLFSNFTASTQFSYRSNHEFVSEVSSINVKHANVIVNHDSSYLSD